MASNVNTVLDDCEQQAKKLVDEIGKYRAAGVLSDQTARSLDALCTALKETQANLEPLTSLAVRRYLLMFGAAMLANLALLIAILVMLVRR